MGLQVIVKKRFQNKLQKTTKYLNDNWGKKEAEIFSIIVIERISLLSQRPKMGALTAVKNVRSVLAGKGNQNKIYYRVEQDKLIIIDMKDIRMNPKANRFNNQKPL